MKLHKEVCPDKVNIRKGHYYLLTKRTFGGYRDYILYYYKKDRDARFRHLIFKILAVSDDEDLFIHANEFTLCYDPKLGIIPVRIKEIHRKDLPLYISWNVTNYYTQALREKTIFTW